MTVKQFITTSSLLILIMVCSVDGKSQHIKPMKVEELVQKYQTGKGVTIVNFWSTWCKPCIEEIPFFIDVADSLKSKGVQLLLVSLDTKEVYESGTLAKFLAKKGWKKNTVWLNETDADHYCPPVDSNWSGVIPVTLIIHPAKNYSRFYETSLNKAALLTALQKAF